MSDQDLKKAVLEIKNVLMRHDLTGTVILASNGGKGEHFYQWDASWSCVFLNEHGSDIYAAIRAKLEDFDSLEDQKRCIEDTVGMLVMFSDFFSKAKEDCDKLLALIAKKLNVTCINRESRG